MAHPIITSDDFDGFVRIVANDFKSELLQFYIDKFYKKYFRQILGDEAYILVQNENRQKWNDIINGVNYTNLDGSQKMLDSLKDQLLKFIYFEFVRDNFTSTQVGKVRQKSEVSTQNTASEVIAIATSRYNEAVEFVNTSLKCFLDNYEVIIEEITAFTDNGGGLYTISIPSTLYLLDGDSVFYKGLEYTATNLVTNTSIDIDTGEAGQVIDGLISWNPYKKISFCEQQYIGVL